MRLVLLSDTHHLFNKVTVPDGDILIHAGDFTNMGKVDEVTQFGLWFDSLPHEHKVLIPGNHDLLFESRPNYARSLLPNDINFLCDSTCVINGLTIFGSPWTPVFRNWAFNYEKDEAEKIWRSIPNQCDIIVTHGPPCGHLDTATRINQSVGCPILRRYVSNVISNTVSTNNSTTLSNLPKLHVFGHIHESYGVKKEDGITFVNASIMDHIRNKMNEPIVLDWEDL